MNFMFYGADRQVTGSCHGISVNGRQALVDCGLCQGGDNGYVQDFAFEPARIDCVIVTHAHIDHSGRLPLLVKQGFSGIIYATDATCSLLEIMLRDSARIQEAESGWKSRKNKRAGGGDEPPMYSMRDVEDVLRRLIPCKYGQSVKPFDGLEFRFTDAGHLFGSAFAEVWLTEDGESKKAVFSGDIGNLDQPIIRDPQYIKEADFVIMESTYGYKNHEASSGGAEDLAKIIDDTLSQGGNVIFPAFAVGRTQELLYLFREIKERGLAKSVPDFPVYVDSPLASAATKIYDVDLGAAGEYLDDDALAILRSGRSPLQFKNLHIIESSAQSKLLNDDRTPKVIISSSGMCEAGRIRHHLKHNLWRRECAVVFTGFQAEGTLGRTLVDGAVRRVTIYGEQISVVARIFSFRNLSAHADRAGLLKWIGAFEPLPEHVFVVHGEAANCLAFTDTLTDMGHAATAPKYTAVYDAIAGRYINEGRDPGRAPRAGSETPAYRRLTAAGRRLLDVISRSRGGTNKDLAKFAGQIDELADKWNRID
ncbi:MAG: MBL fold metallo-hydrolase [Oscillospiraceae bacterium]|jgi:metallo-beta-lactamase family protein|nr:MBL fold metallo-hydrolase [Oscillospiraceae bacterium]